MTIFSWNFLFDKVDLGRIWCSFLLWMLDSECQANDPFQVLDRVIVSFGLMSLMQGTTNKNACRDCLAGRLCWDCCLWKAWHWSLVWAKMKKSFSFCDEENSKLFKMKSRKWGMVVLRQADRQPHRYNWMTKRKKRPLARTYCRGSSRLCTHKAFKIAVVATQWIFSDFKKLTWGNTGLESWWYLLVRLVVIR